jgi:hypothetical protein
LIFEIATFAEILPRQQGGKLALAGGRSVERLVKEGNASSAAKKLAGAGRNSKVKPAWNGHGQWRGSHPAS